MIYNQRLKFLLDEHTEGFDKKLLELGHEIEYVKKLKEQDTKFRNDLNIALHAREHNMILITKDYDSGQACEDNKIPCIWVSDDKIFEKIILPELEK